MMIALLDSKAIFLYVCVLSRYGEVGIPPCLGHGDQRFESFYLDKMKCGVTGNTPAFGAGI